MARQRRCSTQGTAKRAELCRDSCERRGKEGVRAGIGQGWREDALGVTNWSGAHRGQRIVARKKLVGGSNGGGGRGFAG